MKHFFECMQNNPLSAWLFSSALALLLNLGVLFAIPGTHQKNPAYVLFITTLALSTPTVLLIQRFSDRQRREKPPVPPQQEQAIGVLSLWAAVLGMGAFLALILREHIGMHLSDEQWVWLFPVYAIFTMLAGALGYASRRTREGHWALVITIGWITCLVILGGFILIVALGVEALYRLQHGK